MVNKEVFEHIIKECYWDYNITPNELATIVKSGDIRSKSKIFNKIVENSTDRVLALQIFDKCELRELFDKCNNSFTRDRVHRNVLALRNIFLGENNQIKGLEWKKR